LHDGNFFPTLKFLEDVSDHEGMVMRWILKEIKIVPHRELGKI
jgi:hypothetical protein